MVQVYEAILNCNFPGKREFEKGCITNGAIARNYFLLNALLDRSTNFSGITYSGFFSGSFSNTNGVLGYHCLGFANYSNESKTQIGKLVARIESAGGGSFSDFEKGIARRNQWDQSLETLACAAPLIVAYGAGKLMAATGRNMKDSLTSSSASTSSYGSTGEGSGQSSTKVTPASVTKTFTVTNDTLAYHTGDQTGASGTNTITVRGNDGTFLVRYIYNWPSSILIESGRDKSLTGKQVTIQFDGAKATYISCTSGNGKCKITGFSRQ